MYHLEVLELKGDWTNETFKCVRLVSNNPKLNSLLGHFVNNIFATRAPVILGSQDINRLKADHRFDPDLKPKYTGRNRGIGFSNFDHRLVLTGGRMFLHRGGLNSVKSAILEITEEIINIYIHFISSIINGTIIMHGEVLYEGTIQIGNFTIEYRHFNGYYIFGSDNDEITLFDPLNKASLCPESIQYLIDNIGIKLGYDETDPDEETEVAHLTSIHNVYNLAFNVTPKFYFQDRELEVAVLSYSTRRDYLAGLLGAVQSIEINRTKRSDSSRSQHSLTVLPVNHARFLC